MSITATRALAKMEEVGLLEAGPLGALQWESVVSAAKMATKEVMKDDAKSDDVEVVMKELEACLKQRHG